MQNDTFTTEVEKIYEDISERILSGEYAPGQRLVEAKIARDTGVSRTPVRIAIERLVSAGLAQHIPNRGAVVRRMSFEEVHDLFLIRIVNEGLVARLASGRVGPEDEKILQDVLDSMLGAVQAGDDARYYQLSRKIHDHIMRMANSPMLVEFVATIYQITQRYHKGVMLLPGRTRQSLDEHTLIVQAILSGDGDKAEQAMVTHIQRISTFFSNERNKLYF